MNYRALNDEMDKDYYTGDPHICHAEYDAILSKGTPPVKGCTLYVTKYPCSDCAKVIVQSGIKKVVYAKGKPCHDRPHTLEELLKEKDYAKKRMKRENMYLGSKRILTECLVPLQKRKKQEDNDKEGGGGEGGAEEEGEPSHQGSSENYEEAITQFNNIEVELHVPGKDY